MIQGAGYPTFDKMRLLSKVWHHAVWMQIEVEARNAVGVTVTE
jgi:hypothetical protein